MEQVRYLTDDRDLKERLELVISVGGNGDWYVSVVPERTQPTRGVRLCTSGGAIKVVPGLVKGIAQAFHSLNNTNNDNDSGKCPMCGALTWPDSIEQKGESL